MNGVYGYASTSGRDAGTQSSSGSVRSAARTSPSRGRRPAGSALTAQEHGRRIMRIPSESWRKISTTIRQYPENCRLITEWEMEILDANLKERDPTEHKALLLSSEYAKRLMREIEAVEDMLDRLNEDEQSVIRIRFWSGRSVVPYEYICAFLLRHRPCRGSNDVSLFLACGLGRGPPWQGSNRKLDNETKQKGFTALWRKRGHGPSITPPTGSGPEICTFKSE